MDIPFPLSKAPIVIIGGGSTTGGSTVEEPIDDYVLIGSDDFTGDSLDIAK